MANLEDFGFVENPFPIVPHSRVTNWAGREHEKLLLMDVVESVLTIDTGLSEFLILHGTFGAGKSHALRYITTTITDVKSDHFKACAVYLSRVRVDQKFSFVLLYKEIVREIGKECFRTLASVVVERIDAAADVLAEGMNREEERKLKKNDPDHFRKMVIETINEEDRPIIDLLERLDSGEDSILEYLFEGKVPGNKSDVIQAINNDYVATKVLASIFRVMTLKIGGGEPAHRGVYLFLDEVEDTYDLKPAEQMVFWNGIRDLVNRVPEHLGLILSFSADTALVEAYVPLALAERTSRQNLELQSLEVGEAKDFVREHLACFRRPGYEPEQDYYPFTEGAIDYVLESVVVMVPRKIFRYLRTVLERAIRREGLEPGEQIDARMAEEILVAMGV